jgi:protein phosphatase 1 regulatory subunit 7
MIKHIRIQNPSAIDAMAIRQHVQNGDEVIVQFSEPTYDQGLLGNLNALCKELHDNLCVRFYGHYKVGFDCSFLQYLPDVKSLFVDCLLSVQNFGFLRQLHSLSRLNVGVFEATEQDFLSWENLRNLSYLCLVDIRTGSFDLQYLKDYQNLKTLFIKGHTKNIEAVKHLSNLSELSLSIPSKTKVSFINYLPNLRSLKFILGGRENLDEINNYSIEELEIIRVRGFRTFGNLSNFTSLKSLLIEDQIQLETIAFNQELPYLSDLKMLNCKSLNQILGLKWLSNLQQLRVYKTNVDFDEFIKQELPETLKILAFYTTKQKTDEKIAVRLNELGYSNGLKK